MFGSQKIILKTWLKVILSCDIGTTKIMSPSFRLQFSILHAEHYRKGSERVDDIFFLQVVEDEKNYF